ncbi:MAG: hypothetical protein AB7O97_05985 [Planctomycetota bacterium]
MAGRSSNRDRIAHRQAEAAATEQERQQKAAARAAAKASGDAAPRKRATKAPPPRVRIVWAVRDSSGAEVATFPYAEEAAAQEDARQRTAASGRTHFVSKAEVEVS